jgi:hypothetical protein
MTKCDDCGRKGKTYPVTGRDGEERNVCKACRMICYDKQNHWRDKVAEAMLARLGTELRFVVWLELVRKELGMSREQTAIWVTFRALGQATRQLGPFGGLMEAMPKLLKWVTESEEALFTLACRKAKEAE